MKIGLFTDAYEPIVSGVSVSLKILRDELTKLGHEVFIFTHEHPMQVKDSHIIRFKGKTLPMKSMKEYKISKVTNKKMREIFKYELDVIHCHTEFSIGRLGRKVAKRMGIPVVHTYHTMYEDYCHHITKTFARPLRFISKIYSKRFANSATRVIFPTIKVKRTFDRYGFNKESDIIPTGVYLDRFRRINFKENEILSLRASLGIDKNDFVWLFLGRLSREKNIEQLIKEFSKLNLPKSHKLLIVGGGPDIDIFKKLTEKLKLQNQVLYTGMIHPDKVAIYYQVANLFVNFSDTETQGLTFIEALASGLPVLAKYDDNLEGVIINHFNGLTFKENADFKEAYHVLTSNSVKFNEITNNASKAIEQFSAQNYAKNVEQVYFEVLKKG